MPVAQTTGLPGAWEYQGCLEYVHYNVPLDVTNHYEDREPGAVRVFPYQIIYTTDNTPSTCLSQCSDYGYPAGGMEYGDECCKYSFRPYMLPVCRIDIYLPQGAVMFQIQLLAPVLRPTLATVLCLVLVTLSTSAVVRNAFR